MVEREILDSKMRTNDSSRNQKDIERTRKLTDGANKERIVKSIDRHRLSIDLGQKLNGKGILDIFQIDAALYVRRAVSDEQLDHGALVIWIMYRFGNVWTEPGPDKVGGICWVGRRSS